MSVPWQQSCAKLRMLSCNVILFVYSYRDNPTLGDPNSLIEELLEMRNRIRVKEAELVMVRAKVSNNYFSIHPLVNLHMYTHTHTQLNMFSSLLRPSVSPEAPFQLSSPPPPPTSPISGGHPRKSSEGLVGGRDHDFIENEKKRPALCAYCGGMIQRES